MKSEGEGWGQDNEVVELMQKLGYGEPATSEYRPRQPWGVEIESVPRQEEFGNRFSVQGPVGLSDAELEQRRAYLEWRDGRKN